MVRDYCLRLGLVLLLGSATTVVFAQQPKPTQAEPRSAYPEFAKRVHSANLLRQPNIGREPERTLPYDRRRATKTLREISEQVTRMKQRSQTATPGHQFDPERANATLQEIKSVVTSMKQRTRAAQRTIAGQVEEVTVFQYNRDRVPTPQRVESRSGLTHQQLAERKLREKGYIKMDRGWRPAQHLQPIAEKQSSAKDRASVAGTTRNDPF